MNFLRSNPQFVCYAPIDLKDAVFRLRDGWGNQTEVASCTNTDLEPITETVIALTACNLVVPVGTTVHFANDSTDAEYTVASITSAGGTAAVFTMTINDDTGVWQLTYLGAVTTDIAVDATLLDVQNALHALSTMAAGTVAVTGVPGTNYIVTWQSNVAVVPANFTLSTIPTGGAATWVETTPGVADTNTATITLSSGLAEAVEAGGAVNFSGQLLEVRIGEGTVTYDETKAREYIKNRGLLDTVRDGDEEPVDIAFDFVWDYITGVSASGVPTIEDALKQRGEASGWITTSLDTCEPYCVDLEINYTPSCGTNNSELLELQYFRYEALAHNLNDAQISCTGKCNITEAAATRS